MQEPDAATDTVAVERFNRVLAGDVTMQDVPEGECVKNWGAEEVGGHTHVTLRIVGVEIIR